jgi:hypothetical protein
MENKIVAFHNHLNFNSSKVCMVNTTAVRIKEKGHFVPFDANLENVSSLSTFVDDYEDQRCLIQASLKALDSKSTGYAVNILKYKK